MKTILIMLAALPLLAASAGSGRFAGRVFDNNGDKQIPNAIVTVTTPSGYISSVTTDKNGEFAFNSLPDGEYDFRVTAHGFAIYERQVTVAQDLGVRTLDIRLKVPVDRQTISVLELMKPDNTRASVAGY
jgi:hypothetical protein